MVRIEHESSTAPTIPADMPIEDLLQVAAQRVLDGEPLNDASCRILAFLTSEALWPSGHPHPTIEDWGRAKQSAQDRNTAEQYRMESRARAVAGAAATEGARKVVEGYYRLGDQHVKVQKSISGSFPYAKAWNPETETWEYVKGLYLRLRPEMALTAEQAKQFGDLYGRCVFCSTRLTDERSIAAGYGQTCAENHSLPWG